MQTGDITRSVSLACRDLGGFEPSVALDFLSVAIDGGSEAWSAWDAAWIACLTNSPHWAETARCEFARAMTLPAPASD